jgi:hypothetical protein
MIVIKLIGDLVNKKWITNISEIQHTSQASVEISFVGADSSNFIDSLNFGLHVTTDRESVFKEIWPNTGAKITGFDNEACVESVRISVETDVEYSLDFWARENEVFSDSVKFKIPKPEKPFSSWEWQGNRWVPPVAMPTEILPGDECYEWNEQANNWEIKPILELRN